MKSHLYRLGCLSAGLVLTGGAYALNYSVTTICMRDLSSFSLVKFVPASPYTTLLQNFDNPNYMRVRAPVPFVKTLGQPMETNCATGFFFLTPDNSFYPSIELGYLEFNGVKGAQCPAVSISKDYATVNIVARGSTVGNSQCLVTVQ